MIAKILDNPGECIVLVAIVLGVVCGFLLAGVVWGLLVLSIALLAVGITLALAGASWRF